MFRGLESWGDKSSQGGGAFWRMDGGRGVTYLLVQRFNGEQPQKEMKEHGKYGRKQEEKIKNKKIDLHRKATGQW